MRFNHLSIPDPWKHYWTKYPEGYTLLEALFNWVHQVNALTDNVNDWNERLDEFIQTFDKELQETISDILTDWKESGYLEIVIEQALQNQIDRVESDLQDRAINVMNPPVPLQAAAGDGVTDDTLPIQAVINYAYDNGIGTVIVPKTHVITKPLYLWSGDHYGSQAVSLIGENKTTSRIIKTTHNGAGDGSIYDQTDAIVILTDRNISGAYNYNNHIKDIDLTSRIVGNSIERAAFGVYSKYGLAEFVMSDCMVMAQTCFRVDADMWQSTFSGDLFTATKKGFSMGASGTSNLLERCFVLEASEVAYELKGEYSHGNNLAADGCTGIIYKVDFGRWSISGLGAESPNAKKIAVVTNADLHINNIKTFALTSEDAIAFVGEGNGNIYINGGVIGNGETGSNVASKLYETSPYGHVEFNEVKIIDKYAKNPEWGDVGATAGIKNKYSTEVKLKDGKYRPYIGMDRISNKYFDSFQQTSNINGKAIFLDVGNTPTTIGNSSIDVSWSKGGFKGDLFLANDPKAISGLGWVLTDSEGGFLRENTFTKIPLILSGTTANRPSSNVDTGTMYFDTTIGKPVWYKGSGWVDATGASV